MKKILYFLIFSLVTTNAFSEIVVDNPLQIAINEQNQNLAPVADANAQITDVNLQPQIIQTPTKTTPKTSQPQSNTQNNSSVVDQMQNEESNSVSVTKNLSLISKNSHEENPTQYTTIDVSYPQLQGENLSANAQQFNQLISDIVNQQVTQFKKYVAADMVHMTTLPEDVRKNTFNISYDANIVKPSKTIIISVRLTIEGFQAGRAHPYHTYQVLNYDLNNGKVLSLDTLFKPGTNYLNVIAKYSQQMLNNKLQDKWMISEGTKPLAKNFKNWNLHKDSLLITFEEYQVAPYADGAPEVEIPYGALNSIISSQAPIYPCVKHPEVCMGEKA